MDIVQKITEIIEPTLIDRGFELVRVLFQGADTNNTLQIMVEHADHTDMKADDCETLSRALSAVLDVEDVISSRYVLEVTSPGIDRPLLKLSDYERFIGYEAKIETATVHEGQRRFKGTIVSVDSSGSIVLATEGLQITLSFSDIIKAKLILNDKLLKQKN